MLKRTQKYIGMQKHLKWLSYFVYFVFYKFNRLLKNARE